MTKVVRGSSRCEMRKEQLIKGILFANEEEKNLFAKTYDQAYSTQNRHKPHFSAFMDREKCRKFEKSLCSVAEIEMKVFGGHEEAERMMMGFFPMDYKEYMNGEYEEQFPFCALEILHKNRKYGQTDLSHRDYLGSILGLGIERGKIGDILLEEHRAICFVAEELAEYIIYQLERVSRTDVLVKRIESLELSVQQKTEMKRLIVASMRIDVLVAEGFCLSRSIAQELVRREKIFVNWNCIKQTSVLLKEGDMISVRGKGRFLIFAIGDKTKKNRTIVDIKKYI